MNNGLEKKQKQIIDYNSDFNNHKYITLALDNTSNQPLKFRTKNWVEVNENALGTYNTNTKIKFKTTMLNSSLL